MRLLLGLVLLCAGLAAQPATYQELGTTLSDLSRAKTPSPILSAQLVREMNSLSPVDRRPTRGGLARFADEFAAAVAGRDLTRNQIGALQLALMQMMGGWGTNFKPAGRVREVLVAAGIPQSKIQRIVTSLIAIGEEIRGPDDLPSGLVQVKQK